MSSKSKRANMDKWKKETPMMARNRSLHERLLSYAPPHHFPAYIATTLERDENGAYLKIPLISPLAAAYKHQACKYCGSFEVGSSHFTMLFSLFHADSHWHKYLIQSHFPPSVSSKEDVQRRARLLARQQQKMTRSKNSHVLTCNNRDRVFVCSPESLLRLPLALLVIMTNLIVIVVMPPFQ